MTKRVINEVQEYLTVCGEDRVYQIVNVEMLLKKHPGEVVIGFSESASGRLQKGAQADYSKLTKQIPGSMSWWPRIFAFAWPSIQLKMPKRR